MTYPAILPRFGNITSGGHEAPRALVYSLPWLEPGRKRPFSFEELKALDFGPGKIGGKNACQILLDKGLIRSLDTDRALVALNTIQELKDILRQRGLPVSGNKPVLIKRLMDSDFKISARKYRYIVLELTENGKRKIAESRLDEKQAYFRAVDALKDGDYSNAISAYRVVDNK